MHFYLIEPHILQQIDKWLIYLNKNLHYAHKTCIAYRHDFLDFINYMNQRLHKSLSLNELMHLSLKQFTFYLDYRKNTGQITHRSLTRNLSSIKSFFAYQEQHTGMKNEALAHLSLSFKNPKLPRSIDHKDILNILEYLQIHSHKEQWICARNYAIAIILYGSGVRISEALSLIVSQVTTYRTELKIIGKGGVVRYIPYLEIMQQAINDYLKKCPHHLSPKDFIFVGIRGKAFNPRSFYEVLREAHAYLDIPYQFSAHNFRHSCASHLLNEGAHLRTIQALLGHKSLSATNNYLKINHEYLRNVISKSHPRC